MIQKFPYTNLHELNLDWIIQQLIKIEQGAVLSVNGQTGEVVLYQDADVQLPDVVQPDGTWRFFRYVNGKPAGIKFDENGHAYMVDQYMTETEFYTDRNPPDYPVESVNGQTGAVELYQQNGIRFPDVTENYWNIRREVDHNGSPSVEGLEFKDTQPMERISGQNRYPVYDAGNPPPYPVQSVNGQTGAVQLQFPVTSVNNQTGDVTIVIPVQSVNGQTGAVTIDPFVTDATSPIMAVYQVPANATQWGLLRQVKWGSTIDNKKVGIVFDTTGGVFNAYLRVDDGQTVTDLRILTPADIPSDTGVISVNGSAGVVVLDATDIQMETGEDTRTVQTVIAGLELDMSQAFTDIQTVNLNQADGFSTSATYDVGDLVLHNDVLYKCIVAVTTAGAWNSANWQQTTLADELGGGDDNLAYVEDGSTASRNYNAGDYIIWQGTAYQASTAIGSGTTLAVGTNLTAITGGVANALNASIGTLVVGINSSNLSVPSGSFYSCSSVNITAGKWVVSYGLDYNDAFSQTSQIRLVTNASNIEGTTIPGSLIRFPGTDGGGENGCILYEASGATTISLLAFQSSGSAKTVNANHYNISAIRINS